MGPQNKAPDLLRTRTVDLQDGRRFSVDLRGAFIEDIRETHRKVWHVMIDGYGGNSNKMAQMWNMHKMMSGLTADLGISPLDRPYIIPYFDGKIPEDSGVTGISMYPGGHLTVHTFDKKQTVFADVALSQEPLVDPMEALRAAIKKTYNTDREDEFTRGTNQIEDPSTIPEVFGPHLTFQGKLDFHQLSADWIYKFLKAIPQAIEMTPISTPTVTMENGWHDGIAIIAESHIAIHADSEGNYYFDIFSCKEFDIARFFEFAQQFGLKFDSKTVVLAARGKDFPKTPKHE